MKKYLEELPNTWFTKTQQVAIRGTPDYLACINGVFVALELKRSRKEKMTGTLQEHHIKHINSSGGLGVFVFPENWEKMKDVLKAISQRGTYDKANLG